jgi:prevent-host-death family protein
MDDVTLADAKTRLSELVDQALAGDPVRITRRGKPVACLVAISRTPKPIDLEAMIALTDSMPTPDNLEENVVRTMRDQSRY